VDIWLGEGNTEMAYELLGVMEQQGQKRGIRKNSIEFYALSRLDKELPPNLAAAVERGRAWNIEAAIQTVMHDFSRSLEKKLAPSNLVIPALMTERELEILALIADGFSNSEIAEQIILSTGTVKWYVHQILGKLDVTNRTQAVARARTLGLLS
jgi:ATP/maltotriose-dependent transcriptional regulator MalT